MESTLVDSPPSNRQLTTMRPTEELKRKARVDYVVGKGGSPEIARRYNLSEATVKDWVIDGGWVKLRERREQLELSRLEQGLLPAEKPPESPADQINILKGHLKRIDDLLNDSVDAKDMAQLARARADLREQLWIEVHGMKPGTMKPTRARNPRQSADVEPIPEPVPQAQAVDIPSSVHSTSEPNG